MFLVRASESKNYKIDKVFGGNIALLEVDDVFSEYFEKFDNDKDKDKILRIIYIILKGEGIPTPYLKKLSGRKNLWEIKTLLRGADHRYYCCYELEHPIMIVMKIIGDASGRGKQTKRGLRLEQEKQIENHCCKIYKEVLNGWHAGKIL